MTRFYDWPDRLTAYIAARETRPFKWGRYENDCCSFALGAVLEMTGFDVMAPIPEYVTADDADLVLSDYPIDRYISTLFAERPVGLAQRGDLVLVMMAARPEKMIEGEPTLMIVEGIEIVGPGKRRLARLPRSQIVKAWEV